MGSWQLENLMIFHVFAQCSGSQTRGTWWTPWKAWFWTPFRGGWRPWISKILLEKTGFVMGNVTEFFSNSFCGNLNNRNNLMIRIQNVRQAHIAEVSIQADLVTGFNSSSQSSHWFDTLSLQWILIFLQRDSLRSIHYDRTILKILIFVILHRYQQDHILVL